MEIQLEKKIGYNLSFFVATMVLLWYTI